MEYPQSVQSNREILGDDDGGLYVLYVGYSVAIPLETISLGMIPSSVRTVLRTSRGPTVRYCLDFGFSSSPLYQEIIAEMWSFLDISRVSTKRNTTFFYNLQDGLW